ncbi:thioesterase [Mucilaginibacter sp. 21P]|uniref:thioesterase II family protein n=1 Tax=Mucilaginibacter sp. 21P TaxID=2778902 RepID=UPI001C55A172|nr:thioesterase domain-containing protein [Mucilaginibacter sp. 21P]QXV63856.1 thioesterase [Mucilaginibacter sp. 21P]
MKVNLFCFPFAGGSKYSYNIFIGTAHGNITIAPIDYPGRGLRFKEPLLKQIDDVVNDCFNIIKDKLQHPYAFYGHSMGTIVSYLLTKKIIDEGLPKPIHLFLTGRGGPAVVYGETKRYQLPSDKFRAQIKEMGGSPDEVLNDEDLMSFFEPILRADFQTLEEYVYKQTPPFDIPITAMFGSEERVTYEQVLEWQKETTSKLTVKKFEGRHFFIFDHAKSIMDIVAQRLSVQLV